MLRLLRNLRTQNMTRKQGIIALVVVAVLAIAGGGAWYFLSDRASDSSTSGSEQAAAPEAKGPVSEPVVMVIDKAALLRGTKAGQDISQQVNTLAAQARSELDPANRALQAEAAALRAQVASMTPEQRQARVGAFEQKQAAFQQMAQVKQQQLQMALANANHEMEKALGPILKQVMAERHANIVLDKQVVVLATSNEFDATADVIHKLDEALPSVKVTLPSPQAAAQQPQGAAP